MTRFTQLLGIALISAAVSAEPQPRNAPKNEAEQQPGTIRITGVQDSDQVLLDGELVGDGKQIARFGSKLLVNPGQYTVTIVSDKHEACELHVAVRENRTALASCSTQAEEEFVD